MSKCRSRTLKNKLVGAGGCGLGIEHMVKALEALGSIPSTRKKIKLEYSHYNINPGKVEVSILTTN
jgi:hypothetical protein